MKEQVLRFLLVGGFSTVVNYLIFYVLLNINNNYIISSSLGYLVGVFIGYIFNKSWTFNSKNKSKIEILKYYMVYLFSLLIGVSLLKLQVEFLNIDARVANVLVIFITTILNFIGTKFMVFNNQRNGD